MTEDMYNAKRCVNCRHLRYRTQQPGDPCLVCPCTDHVLPGEVVPSSGGEGSAA
jgi:hypothetical protein